MWFLLSGSVLAQLRPQTEVHVLFWAQITLKKTSGAQLQKMEGSICLYLWFQLTMGCYGLELPWKWWYISTVYRKRSRLRLFKKLKGALIPLLSFAPERWIYCKLQTEHELSPSTHSLGWVLLCFCFVLQRCLHEYLCKHLLLVFCYYLGHFKICSEKERWVSEGWFCPFKTALD